MGQDPSGPPQKQLTMLGEQDVYQGPHFPPGETMGSGKFSYPSNAICLGVCGAGDILLPHPYVLGFSHWCLFHK